MRKQTSRGAHAVTGGFSLQASQWGAFQGEGAPTGASLRIPTGMRRDAGGGGPEGGPPSSLHKL